MSPVIPGLFWAHAVSWHGFAREDLAYRTDSPGAAMRPVHLIPVLLAGYLIAVLCRGDEPRESSAGRTVATVAASEFRAQDRVRRWPATAASRLSTARSRT